MDLERRASALGYASIPPTSVCPAAEDEDVLHLICLSDGLDRSAAVVRAVRQTIEPDAVLLAAGVWNDPAEIGQMLAAGADDYLSLNCETRELAVRLLALQVRVRNRSKSHGSRQLEDRLRHAQRLETLGAVAGAMAHSYNNLLAAIQGNAELALMDRTLPDALKYCLTQIDTVSQRAGDLTRQMQVYIRNRDGGSVLAVSLNQIVQEMGDLLRVSASSDCALKVSLARNVPPMTGRAAELRQMLLNLVWNACEAVGDSGGEVRIRTLFQDEAEPALVTLEVEDTGPGVPENLRARIFDPLFSTKGEDRGLGLAVAREIAESHGGTIDVTSGTGGGACFRVRIPPVPDWRMNRPVLAAADLEAKAALTVLLIDEEPAVREAAEKSLRRAGYTVFAADNAIEGWKLCEQVGMALDAVILDPRIHGMKPRELVQGIRTMYPRMPIVVWSGADETAAKASLSGAEPYDFLRKEPQMGAFIAGLDALLRGNGKA
ncbi:ATP-binding protein [uncultured Paludibaculum sp.]|uniref:hybrid sensor histidine kinase/response regulator n=1 Tax=uncultured Paludibaculum sp. TaxID=1765020 RepID=UPI002AAB3FB2|nr:ATP-binding protein [uncultured Paludibaculum sp.]